MVSTRDVYVFDDGLTSDISGDAAIFQEFDLDVIVRSAVFEPIDVKIQTNRYSQAGMIELEGLFPPNRVPDKGDQVTVYLNDHRVFTGLIEKYSNKGHGLWSITALDGIKNLLRTKIDRTFDRATLRQVAYHAARPSGFLPIADLPETRVSPDYNGTAAIHVINQVAKWGDVLWWVDAYDRLHLEPPDPTVHRIGPEFIEENPTAGEKEPPYQRVIVQGESPASEASGTNVGGFPTWHMMAKEPVVATAGEGNPTYRYESKQIRTQGQAQAAADAILKEFQRQRAHGDVSIVGEGAPIRPFDVIEMPDMFDHERYLVSGVTHHINNQDGFITDVDCGGLIDGYVEDVPVYGGRPRSPPWGGVLTAT